VFHVEHVQYQQGEGMNFLFHVEQTKSEPKISTPQHVHSLADTAGDWTAESYAYHFTQTPFVYCASSAILCSIPNSIFL
jgi:hypothetical protein